jgi:hypothetical protein
LAPQRVSSSNKNGYEEYIYSTTISVTFFILNKMVE